MQINLPPNLDYTGPTFFSVHTDSSQNYGAGHEKNYTLNYERTHDTNSYNAASSKSAGLRDDTDSKRSVNDMSESEIKRLEDRISHTDQIGQVRLEKAMADINGKISLILERTDGIKADISASRASETQHFQWLAGLMVASVLATILAIGGFAYSAKSLWAGGFSSGQADRVQAAAPTSPLLNH